MDTDPLAQLNDREQIEAAVAELRVREMNIAGIHQRLNEIEQRLPGGLEIVFIEESAVEGGWGNE